MWSALISIQKLRSITARDTQISCSDHANIIIGLTLYPKENITERMGAKLDISLSAIFIPVAHLTISSFHNKEAHLGVISTSCLQAPHPLPPAHNHTNNITSKRHYVRRFRRDVITQLPEMSRKSIFAEMKLETSLSWWLCLGTKCLWLFMS